MDVGNGSTDIGANRLPQEFGAIFADTIFDQRFHDGPDSFENGIDVGGTAFARVLEFVEGGLNGAAVGVAENDNQARFQVFCGVFDASELGGATILPATRITKRSPSPWSKTISGGTRESEQQTTIAKGFCPPRRLSRL